MIVNQIFYKYYDIKKFGNLSLFLNPFRAIVFNDLGKFDRIIPPKAKRKKKKTKCV